MDFVHATVSAARPTTPVNTFPPVDLVNEGLAIKKTVERVVAARNPLVLVDCLATRHEAIEERPNWLMFCSSPSSQHPWGSP